MAGGDWRLCTSMARMPVGAIGGARWAAQLKCLGRTTIALNLSRREIDLRRAGPFNKIRLRIAARSELTSSHRINGTMTKNASMLDALTQLAAKVDAAIQASPASNLERNARQHFVSQLARHGLVAREEYEIQTELLEKTRTKLKALESRIAALEAERRPSGAK